MPPEHQITKNRGQKIIANHVLPIVIVLSGMQISLQGQQVIRRPVIPAPVSIEESAETFTFPRKTVIGYSSKDMAFTARYLKDFYAFLTSQKSQIRVKAKGKTRGTIVLVLDPAIEQAEGYRLDIKRNQIIITGKNPQGVFFGVQSLSQLLYERKRSGDLRTLPCLTIVDYPRFPWRGLHLDVSRHFFDKDFIKRYIDILALHKMNTFHWHLVDDQGWRIEIKKYPKLTSVGAWRIDREDLPWTERPDQKSGEKATYGGFYTREEIKDIVAYAAERFITIVPEIEMPAHVSSVLAAYPEYSCRQVPITVPPGSHWPCTNVYCAGNDSTFLFLQDILDEVMNLFPSKYIHIGGDEADKTEWKQCLRCQARIRDENLKDEHELQSYFIRRIDKYLTQKGRILIGWDEILEGGLAENATVMSWRGTEGGIRAARMNHDVVMTPESHCYFDRYQSPDRDIEPRAFPYGNYTNLEKVYSYDPVPEGLTSSEAKHILGAQGNAWTEYMLYGSHVEYMILPRAIALSEVVWSPYGRKDYPEFLTRLENQLDLLHDKGINFYIPSVEGLKDTLTFTDTLQVRLINPYPFGEIRYTIDGSEPSYGSPRYRKPLFINRNTVIKAAIYLKNGRSGKVKTGRFIRE
ncbi:MAG: family 20 glycosylhydrolase [Bacteroidales bacterium]|nr:family 20 glycosylhydrolase [Bacteroidales bacterium]MBN2763374.1 family 20 glycosylhydrolase [Bacteroidales bacterium]